MTNRQRLLSSSEYDTLCKMQKNMDGIADPCIMDALGEERVHQRCIEYKGDCNECIRIWLNEESHFLNR